jgi:short-subunit dehydrogenase
VREPKSNGSGNRKVGGWVLVTGASSGIGAELARAFARRRYDLVLAARTESAIEALGREIAETHAVRVKTLPVDLSAPGAPQAMAEALGRAGVEIGILVNNAGVLSEGPFADGAPEAQLNLIDVNIVALTALMRLFLPAMVARGEGRILNVASIAAFTPVPQLAIYAASKAYVLSLTEAVGQELKGTGMTATALCPGLTDTAMMRRSELGRPIPAMMMMSAKDVAEAGCAACLGGEAVLVPGLANKLIAGGGPRAPRGGGGAVGGGRYGGGWGRRAQAGHGGAGARAKAPR